MKNKLLIALMSLSLVAGCSSEEKQDAPKDDSDTATTAEAPAKTDAAAKEEAPAEPPLEYWIVGAWSYPDTGCASDVGITYNRDGTYNTYGEDGTWSLRGDRLELTPRTTYEMASDEAPKKIENPETVVQTIVAHDGKSYATRFSDGQEISFIRCD